MTLASLQTAYPDFVPNQVLTDAQLNQLRDYLDGQTRLGRLRTVGQGVACGLTVSVTGGGTPSVRVEGGYGITSDGFLIEHGADAEDGDDVVFAAVTFTHVVDYQDPVRTVGSGGSGTPPAYTPWQDGGGTGQITLLRLLTASETPDAGTPRALAPADLAGHAVVLYLEQAAEELDGCFVTSCDDRGRRVQHAVRALLVATADLAATPTAAAVDPPPPAPRVPRLQTILVENNATIADIGSREDLVELVKEAVNRGGRSVVTALKDVVERYGPAAGLDDGLVDEVNVGLDLVQELLPEAPFAALEHVGTLAEAVALLGRAGCRAATACGAPGGYARHLALGRTDGAAGRRHLFRPALAAPAGALAEGRRAADRLRVLSKSFDTSRLVEADDLTLTASQTPGHPLRARAIPAYYDAESVAPVWGDACDGGPFYQAGAAVLPTGEPAGDEPLHGGFDAAYGGVSLVRVEGHLERGVGDVVEALRKRQGQLGLEFALVAAGLDGAPDVEGGVDLAEWAVDKPGLEPVAGVEPGGTFVLLSVKGTVVGDLALRCCGGPPEEETQATTGALVVVVTSDDGVPLSGATVAVSRLVADTATTVQSALSDADGRVEFVGLAPGTVSLRVSRSGYQTQTLSGVAIEAGGQTDESVVLAALVLQGVVQIIACPGRVPDGSVTIDGRKLVEVAEGGSETITLDEGDHTLAVPVRPTAKGTAPTRGTAVGTRLTATSRFERAAAAETPFTVEAGRRTILFLTQDKASADTVLVFTEDIPKGIPADEVRVRVYHDSVEWGRLTVETLESGKLLTPDETADGVDNPGVAPGAVTAPVPAPAQNDRLQLASARDKAVYEFPAKGLGRESLAVLVCDDGVRYVLANGETLKPLVVTGGIRAADEEADISVRLPDDKVDVLKLREAERVRDAEAIAKGAGIKNTNAYDEAEAFIEKTATRSDIRGEDLTEAYRELVETLEPLIQKENVNTSPGYRALLETATMAYLDRAARYPDGGGPEVDIEIDRIQETLVLNGINADAVREKWNPAELEAAVEATSGRVRYF